MFLLHTLFVVNGCALCKLCNYLFPKNCLTELGHKHAAAAAERLKNDGIEEIYSSPYGRAVETAEHTANMLGLEVRILDFMHEITWGLPGGKPHEGGHPWSTADEMAKCADFINGTKVRSEVALLFTSLCWNLFEYQPQLQDLKYQPRLYKYFYAPLVKAGIRPDVIGAKKDLSAYKILFAPMALTLEDGDLAPRIAEWVKNGGILISGPMTDLRNAVGARYIDKLYGHLEELADVLPLYEIPDTNALIKCQWRDGTDFVGKDWYELFKSDEHSLASVTDGYPSLVGTAPLAVKQVGKGKIYFLGTFPTPAVMERLLDSVLADAPVEKLTLEGEVFAARRQGAAGEGLMVAECGGKNASITLECEMTDLLTDKTYQGTVALEPYQLLILKK